MCKEVDIRPVTGQPEQCEPDPFYLNMGTDGIAHVKFVNHMQTVVYIEFHDPDSIVEDPPHKIDGGGEHHIILTLKHPEPPVSNKPNKEYFYSVSCPFVKANPKIIIPHLP